MGAGRAALAVLIALLLATLAACGEESQDEQPAEQQAQERPRKEPAGRCQKVPAAARAALGDALKGRRKLGAASAVRSEQEVMQPAPAGFTEGVYFVTADVQPNPGLSTWAVDAELLRTGGGLAYVINPAARAASNLGVDVDPSRWGLDEQSEGFEASMRCAGKASG
jgi:hypothetical protein